MTISPSRFRTSELLTLSLKTPFSPPALPWYPSSLESTCRRRHCALGAASRPARQRKPLPGRARSRTIAARDAVARPVESRWNVPRATGHSVRFPLDWTRPYERGREVALRKLRTVGSGQMITDAHLQAAYQAGWPKSNALSVSGRPLSLEAELRCEKDRADGDAKRGISGDPLFNVKDLRAVRHADLHHEPAQDSRPESRVT